MFIGGKHNESHKPNVLDQVLPASVHNLSLALIVEYYLTYPCKKVQYQFCNLVKFFSKTLPRGQSRAV